MLPCLEGDWLHSNGEYLILEPGIESGELIYNLGLVPDDHHIPLAKIGPDPPGIRPRFVNEQRIETGYLRKDPPSYS